MSNRYILLITIFPLLFNSCEEEEKDYIWTPVITRNSSTNRTENNLQGETIAAKDFITMYINSYLKEVDSIVIPKFRDSLFISDSKKYSARLVTSSKSESLLFFFPSDSNKLIIDFTEFPIQLALFFHIDVFGKNQFTYDKEFIIDKYNQLKPSISFDSCKTITWGNTNFVSRNPKIFAINSCILLLKNCNFEISGFVPNHGTKKDKLFKTHLDFCFFTSNTTFTNSMNSAKRLGISQAQNDIMSLYIKSQFFRKALAHKKLKPLADSIATKKSRRDKDHNFDYPLWEFEMDKEALEDLAKKEGIELSYADSILAESQNKRQDGYFIFYYSNFTIFQRLKIFYAFIC